MICDKATARENIEFSGLLLSALAPLILGIIADVKGRSFGLKVGSIATFAALVLSYISNSYFWKSVIYSASLGFEVFFFGIFAIFLNETECIFLH